MDARMWTDMFALGLPVLEKILRPIIVHVFLSVGLRLAGKRQLAQLEPFDLVVLLTLSNTVQNAIIGEDNSVTGGLLGAATLLVVNALVARVIFARPRLERLVEGDPVVLIDGGRLQADALHRELITQQELEVAAHRQGFDSLQQLDRAVRDPAGTVFFKGRHPAPEDTRHAEVLRRLDALQQEMTGLRAALGTRS